MKLFDIIKTIFNKEPIQNDDEIFKAYTPFIANRVFSFTDNKTLGVLTNYINLFNKIGKYTHYRFMHSILPKKRYLPKYLKPTKKEINIDKEEVKKEIKNKRIFESTEKIIKQLQYLEEK